jgi:deazaflavin-dependent oxidoreductase (nitroreductase family)
VVSASDADLKQVLDDAREIELTVTGRKTGNESTRPVWFAEEGERIYLLPVGGSGSNWYRNVEQTPRVGLAVGGAHLETEATALTDAAEVNHVVEIFRDKYGDSVDRYYPDQDAAVEASLA